MSIRWESSQEPTAAPSLPHVPLTPAFSLASIFTPFSPDHFPLTPLFSIRRFHSFSFFFTLKSVSPLLATLTQSTPGYTPQILFAGNNRSASRSHFTLTESQNGTPVCRSQL